MRVGEVKSLIKKLYAGGKRQTILLLGPPGVGKSVLVREVAIEIASELNKAFVEYSDGIEVREDSFVYVDLRLSEVEPSDLIGIPERRGGHYVYLPPKWAQVLSQNPGILVLDELTNVQRPDVLSAAFKIILDRAVGFTKLHRDVLIVAAGNRPDDSGIASELPAPVVNRVILLNVEPPTIEEWGEWMSGKYGDKWDKRVLAFLTANKAFFIGKPESANTLNQFPTPRQWTNLALIGSLTEKELEEVAVGLVGREAGIHFMAFIKNMIPDYREFKSNILMWNEFNDSQKYLMSLQIAEDSDSEFVIKVMAFLLSNDREFIPIILKIMKALDVKKVQKVLTLISQKNKELYNFILNAIKAKLG